MLSCKIVNGAPRPIKMGAVMLRPTKRSSRTTSYEPRSCATPHGPRPSEFRRVVRLPFGPLDQSRDRRDGPLRRAIATSRANATSIVGRDFRPNHTEQRAIAAPRAFNGLCDDEGVPLICPTCQVLPPKRPCRRLPATLHGVVFDIFGWEPKRRGGEISCFSDEQGRGYAVAPPLIGLDETARMDSGL